jgi:hypothetical protein
VQWVSALRQSDDYLESRDEVDTDRIGYPGISNGALWGPLYRALEPRIRTRDHWRRGPATQLRMTLSWRGADPGSR